MRTTQYVRAEKAIAAAESGSIRSRWLFGLRLLRDPEAMSSPISLKHGVAEQLISAARGKGLKLSEREIRRRIQCARAYSSEDQIGRAAADFGTWRDLYYANFPDYPPSADEAPADHRTDEEKEHERHARLLDLVGEQGALFPLDRFEPDESTLKELEEYASQQEDLTARFVAVGLKRRAYVDRLVAAADGDLSLTWSQAQALLPDAGLEDPAG